MNDLTKNVFTNNLAGLRGDLAQGTDPNEQDDDGRTPLIHAAIDGKLEVAKLLLENGADVNVQDNLGYSALHYSAQNYLPDMTALLIARGAKVDAEDLHGNTPLGSCVRVKRKRRSDFDFAQSWSRQKPL
ncbi:MAG: ankyrin repeat domain-containing protein [Patescibacteria group bacterium]|nr:ankyrin repeat domain-containing protein [Patescibacteria group bacterium]